MMARTKSANVIDQWLPLIKVRSTEAHMPVAVLEVADAALLLELAANPKIRRYFLGRLSDSIALVDPGQEDALAKSLLANGHTPKTVKGAAQ